ncbi:cytidine deaminase [Volucribacter psittacicida]|uniref:Cytidine deaminase n=1 Tax=Volucribacter psittacicida TaxID=203482 RepID=A0A4R1G2J5_9PAST|nr:cytidine deaminase [Volucribacter psittacicida]TCK01828.1 cytidine deaminase [Volucribacter psittacicida]
MPQCLKDKIQQALIQFPNQSLARTLWLLFSKQQFSAVLNKNHIIELCQQYKLTPITLNLQLLPIAACYATAPISQFHVGAIVTSHQGDIYFGANQEFCGTNIQQTIHAEQSAITHAWMRGVTQITDITINYSPCGHCRQFLNELNKADQLAIHLPHQQNLSLQHYLPNAFGPQDLAITQRLLLPSLKSYKLPGQPQENPAILTALQALNLSHSPYSQNCHSIVIETKDKQYYMGSYAENAAFNPSLPALQVALNHLLLQGKDFSQISKVYMLEKSTQISYRNMAEELLSTVSTAKLHYLSIE